MNETISAINAALEGRYRIEREVGAGGMATVFLAQDLRHDRRVALKVLKPELAAVVGAERFLTEIKTTANLQHPHVLPLHDSGEAGSFLFYVMPFVEGESLRERLDREHQLPVDDAVSIAVSLAEALDYAHGKGIVHRDIKPANILVQAGKPVIADFGIALAVGAAGGGRLTETGLSLGTPHYMSPEQATGDPTVGVGTDVYALGCVLYEMLVGEPPYTGSTAQAVLGRILAGDLTAATTFRPAIPAHVDAAIRKALESLPADRFRTAGEFAQALGNPAFRHGAVAETTGGDGGGPWKGVSAVLALTTIAFGTMAYLALSRPEPPRPVERFESPFRLGQVPQPVGLNAFALSPDGSFLVFRMGDEADQLWVRRWDDPEASPIRGTEGGRSPAVSPDGERLAFERDGVHVVAVGGGPVTNFGEGGSPAWGDDGMLYWNSTGGGVLRAPGTGGPADTVPQAPLTSTAYVGDVLPGGAGVLVGVGGDVGVVDPTSGEVIALADGYSPEYAPSGHLVYLSSNTLMAAPFDAKARELGGPPVALLDRVRSFSMSRTGKLFYTPMGESRESEFVWVSRSGQATPVVEGWRFNAGGTNPGWSLSPDGTKLAYRHTTGENDDIWIRELPAGPNRRLTNSDWSDQSPRWSPDGQRIVYASGPSEACCGIWTMRADGVGEPTLLHHDPFPVVDGQWSPDEEWLVLRIFPRGTRGRDIVALRPGVDSVARPLLTENYDEKQPALSPDGRWLAYTSTESGREEIFVRPFPEVDSGKWQVSTGGGVMPAWAPEGRELFFVDDDDRMVAAQVVTAGEFAVSTREILFDTSPYLVNGSNILVSVSPDGARFLMARPVESEAAFARFVLVNNFDEVLKERVPR